MSIVPPAKSMRVGAEAVTCTAALYGGVSDPTAMSASMRSKEQDRDRDDVTYAVGGGPVQEIGEQAVTVGGHRDEVDVLFFGNLDQLCRWIAHCQTRINRESSGAQRIGNLRQIRPILTYFFRFPKL